MKLAIFRSNLRIIEDYHHCKTLEEFEKKCWDFYLLMGLWYLKNNYVNRCTIYRLQPLWKMDDYKFCTNDELLTEGFYQRWVQNFPDMFNPVSLLTKDIPDISFFRGGFKEYDELTNRWSHMLGKKMYLAAGQRTTPQWDGKYDSILVESNKDLINDRIPFYKTVNPNIFYNMNIKTKKYDLCWIANFSSIRYKGNKFFIKEISNSNYLKSLKIAHVGNKPEEGIKLCKKYGINNITFLGHLDRPGVNEAINNSKFGIITSNNIDGCPRAITEILSTGTPLLLRSNTRLLDYYKKYGVVEFNDNEVDKKISYGLKNYENLKDELQKNIDRFSMDTICRLNWNLWTKK